MKKRWMAMLVLTLALILTGCNYVQEKKAEGLIKNYYKAMINEDYKKAFRQLQLYDYDANTQEGHYTKGTALTKKQARKFYLKKIHALEEQNYKILDFKIVKVEYEDGHSFWHHLKIEVEQSGKKYEWKEVAQVYKGKLLIGTTDDPYVNYRDGKMNTEIENVLN